MNSSTGQNPPLNGQVTTEGDHARLFYQRFLPHPPEKVWAALTQPDQLKQWFMTASAKIDGRVGGTVETVAGPAQFHSKGRILQWDPPRLYEYEWIVGPAPQLPVGENSVIRWALEAREGGTFLTLVHSRLTKQTARGFAPGFHVFLDRLAAQLSGVPMPDWMQRFAEVRGGYEGVWTQ